jgi:adenosylcobinamide-phosphate synthase
VVSLSFSQCNSPNAGWPEAAMAGALGVRLAGPRVYNGVQVNDHWMGDGYSDLTAADIRAALKLYRLACALQIAALAGLVAISVWR